MLQKTTITKTTLPPSKGDPRWEHQWVANAIMGTNSDTAKVHITSLVFWTENQTLSSSDSLRMTRNIEKKIKEMLPVLTQ